jgi:hypothetical protein
MDEISVGAGAANICCNYAQKVTFCCYHAQRAFANLHSNFGEPNRLFDILLAVHCARTLGSSQATIGRMGPLTALVRLRDSTSIRAYNLGPRLEVTGWVAELGP